jgi:predicted O-methyltransferase YrrM
MFDPMGLPGCAEDLNALDAIVRETSNRMTRRLSVVEVGSWAGMSALAMLNTGRVGAMWCVDNWKGNPNDCLGPIAAAMGQNKAYETFKSNLCEFLDGTVKPILGDSVEVASGFTRNVDLVFIDAQHDYTSVRDDIVAWIPKLNPGGVLCGHDYTQEFPGVMDAVRTLFAINCLIVGRSIWTVRV